MKNILIITYHFYPENTPRAFRAYELAMEYSRKGFNVDVVIPYNSSNYDDLSKNSNIRIIKTKDFTYEHEENNGVNSVKAISKIRKFRTPLKKIYRFFVPEDMFGYAKAIKNVKGDLLDSYEQLISIGMPFCVHLGVSKLIKTNKNIAKVKIADYGDPFYFNKFSKKLIVYKWIEKHCAKFFDYITIPVESSIQYYKHINNGRNIKIIPQGFNFSDIELCDYKKNEITTFGFAGIFYEGHRDPRFLLDFLSNCKEQFKFVIYTDTKSSVFNALVEPYIKTLKDKLEIRPFIPRLECIKELSKLDFLINIENLNSGQTPSKVIDYSLANRPIYNCNQSNFSKEDFYQFMNENYEKKYCIDISKYDIRNVVDEFQKLVV